MMDKLDETAGSQETQVSNKERPSARNVVRISLGAAVGVLITTIGLGYVLGRINSPDWEDLQTVRTFIAGHYSGRFLETAGRQPLPESDPIELRFRLDDRYLVYRTDTEAISEDPLPIEEVPANQTRRSKDNQSLIQSAFALGASAAASLGNVRVSLGNWLGKTPKGKFTGFGAAAAALGAGGFWGYSMSFRGDPDYSSKMFQEKLHDRVVWRGLARDYRSRETSLRRSRRDVQEIFDSILLPQPPPGRAAPSATP